MPPQYFNRSEEEIELQSTRDPNFGKAASISKPRNQDTYQGGKLFDDNLLFEAHTPLTQLEQNLPLLIPRPGDEDDSEENNEEMAEGDKPGVSPAPSRPDPRYLAYALCGCLCFASGGILRKY